MGLAGAGTLLTTAECPNLRVLAVRTISKRMRRHRARDQSDRRGREGEQQLRARPQSSPQHRVRQIRLGLGARSEPEALPTVAPPQRRELREDEPDPVRPLPAGSELREDGLVHRGLRIEVVLEGVHQSKNMKR